MNDETTQRKLNTICVHSGGIKDDTWHGITSPIISSTAYHYRKTKKRGYPRYFQSPNQEAVINKLCELEHTESGVLVSSGMGFCCKVFRMTNTPVERAYLCC